MPSCRAGRDQPCGCPQCRNAWQHDLCPSPAFFSEAQPRSLRKEKALAGPVHCYYCGSTQHLFRACTFGSSLHRVDQFLTCSPQCFVRRFVVPLHRARTDFSLHTSLRTGRIDVAARLVCASLICSQRLRHNTELWLPFLGDEHPSTLCVTGGTVRGLHPSERSTATRLREFLDGEAVCDGEAMRSGREGMVGECTAADPGGELAAPEAEHDSRGFRRLDGGLAAALTEALSLARDGGTRAPLLLLLEGAPPLPDVLASLLGGDQSANRAAAGRPLARSHSQIDGRGIGASWADQ